MIDTEAKLDAGVLAVINVLPDDWADATTVLGATLTWLFAHVPNEDYRAEAIDGFCRMLRGEAPPNRSRLQ